MMIATFLALALGSLCLVGCTARSIEMPLTHPANPAALEAPAPTPSTTLKIQSTSQPQLEGEDG